MTRKSEKLLSQLVAFAGSAELVQQALMELNAEAEEPPTLEEVARRIVQLRNAAAHEAADDADAEGNAPASTPVALER